MTAHFPASYSTLAAPALLAHIGGEYGLGPEASCELFSRGLNDTYLIAVDGERRYTLRVYRAGWRTLPEIDYELAALRHLQDQGVAVSAPITRQDGGYTWRLDAPEGERYAVLFSYAPGVELTYDDVRQARLYGQAVAQVHAAGDGFSCASPRFQLDLDHLIAQPLKVLQPWLAARPEDWAYVEGLAARLRRRVEQCADELERGFCHGDFHGWNASVDAGETITFYDFDCCGYGWRAYDLAVFRWSMRLLGQEQERWATFLEGYESVRPLRPADREAVPLFIGIRQLWLLGLHLGNASSWGHAWLNAAYFDRALDFLRGWEQEHLPL